MGVSASRSSSPSPPAKCSMPETRSATRLFTVRDYSKWVLMPPDSALIFDDTLRLFCFCYDLKVYPAGYDKEAADYVAVFAQPTVDSCCYNYPKAAARTLIEILDGDGERTVFDNHTAKSEQTLDHDKRSKGYVRFVKRRELEASGCVHDDSITIRFTVSVDVHVTRPAAKVMEALTAAASDPSKKELSGSHVLTIGQFKRIKAGLRIGECVHSTQFSLGGSSWYFKVYPNGHYDGIRTRYNMSVFLARGRSDSDEPATTAKFRFELPGCRELRSKEHTFDHDHPEHEFRYIPDLAGQMIEDDRLVVRCHLRVIKAATPILLPTEEPPTATAPPYDWTDEDEF